MPATPSPRTILETLLPHLRVAARYAHQIQTSIVALPDKGDASNAFAAALTAADLSVQTAVEVALLGTFPHLHFYGEEYEKSFNTGYVRSQDLSPPGNYLVTLDPIDGTRFYVDGHDNYQILLGVLGWDEFEAVLAITPAQNRYAYALRGEGLVQGALHEDLDACTPVQIEQPQAAILLGSAMTKVKPYLPNTYEAIAVETDYDQVRRIPNVNGVLTGELAGAVLRGGKFIDGAAIAFLATEMGYVVTTHQGEPLPPLHTCSDYARPGLIIAASAKVHQDLLHAVQAAIARDATESSEA
ncbi:MAG TPA: inositol monophosphatase family protein [Candidatus Obscuribacterales bacterium]